MSVRDQHPISTALLRHPVAALMLFVLIAVLGVVAYTRIPTQLVPTGMFSDPSMSVRVSVPNSSPEEVAEKVTRPIEEIIRTLPGVTEISSESSASDADIDVTFGQNQNMEVAYADLKDRLERVKPDLPDGVGDIRIRRFSANVEFPVLFLGITFKPEIEDPYGLIERVIQPRFEAIDGVALVDIRGMVLDTVRVNVKPEQLRAHGLSLYDVVAKMRRDNFTLPAGAIEDAGREFLLRIDTTYRSLDDIKSYPLADNVKLEDVAEVRIAKTWRDYVSRVDGEPAVSAQISKESDKNAVEVCANLLRGIDEMRADARLEGFSFVVYWNQSDMIVSSLGELKSSMAWGGLFSIIVIYVFVRRLALTLLVAAAIPISLLAAVVALYFSGMSFNLISLAGFTIAIGMLVDDSIVVTENIDRQRSEGVPGPLAAAAGAGQVALAIILSTLTTLMVFAPLVFMSSSRSVRMRLAELALPLAYSLLASLLVALVFLPITILMLERRRGGATSSAAHVSGFQHTRLHRWYRGALAFGLAHRFGVIVSALVIVAGAWSTSALVEKSFGGGSEGRVLRVAVELPSRFTLREASDVFEQLEGFLEGKRAEYSIKNFGANFRRNRGRLDLYFPNNSPPDHERELSKRMKDELPVIPGVLYRLGFEGGGESQGSVRVQLEGPDFTTLARLADEVVRELQKVPDLTNVRYGTEEGQMEELRIAIDRDKARRYGVSQEVLQGLISWGVGGQRLAGLKGTVREIPMIIEFEDPEEGNLEYLRGLSVAVGSGGTVPLGTLTNYSFEHSLGSIERRNGLTSLMVRAESLDKNSYRVLRSVADVMDRFPFPDGYHWRESGDRRRFEEDQAELLYALLAGIVFVFLLMGMMFESTIIPLAILGTIPLAIAGAFAALYLTGTPLDGMANLALILLAGVVVRNGIVLIDRIRQLRDTGLERADAVLTGCSQRLRPVLMTALTTIFGLVPMALPQVFGSGGGSGGISYKSLAIATLGGLMLSSALTLLVVPILYTLFDDLRLILLRMVKNPAPVGTPVERPVT